MKKMLCIYVLLALSFMGFCEENMTVSIKLKLSALYGGGEIEIYNDTYSHVAHAMAKIENARTIDENSIIKEALAEGSYYIIIKKNGTIIGFYEVFNSQNVYDLQKNKYLKCDVLLDIYQIFVSSFLRDRINR